MHRGTLHAARLARDARVHTKAMAAAGNASTPPGAMQAQTRHAVDYARTREVGATRWLRLETLSYSDGTGRVGAWDRCVRTTKSSEESTDAVAVLAVLRFDAGDPGNDKIVFVKQFRPPVNAFTLELPAGLIDKGESAADAALREFAEETGYAGAVVDVSPSLPLSPGLTNENVALVRLDVDMTRPENRKPLAALDASEKGRGLETLLLPRKGLLRALREVDAGGVRVFGMVYTLAMGLDIGGGQL